MQGPALMSTTIFPPQAEVSTRLAARPLTPAERTARDWLWDECHFGEWFPRSLVQEAFSRQGYSGSTPEQYACKLLARGKQVNDFEVRPNGKEWRWIDHNEQGQRS